MTKLDQKKATFVFDKVQHCYSGVPALEKIDLKINEGEKLQEKMIVGGHAFQ